MRASKSPAFSQSARSSSRTYARCTDIGPSWRDIRFLVKRRVTSHTSAYAVRLLARSFTTMPTAGRPIHLGEVTHGGRLVQMMQRQGRDDHVDRPAPHGQVDGIPLEDDDLGIGAPQT